MNHVSSYPCYPLLRRESSVDLKLKNGQSDGKVITASKSCTTLLKIRRLRHSWVGVAEACDQLGLGLDDDNDRVRRGSFVVVVALPLRLAGRRDSPAGAEEPRCALTVSGRQWSYHLLVVKGRRDDPNDRNRLASTLFERLECRRRIL